MRAAMYAWSSEADVRFCVPEDARRDGRIGKWGSGSFRRLWCTSSALWSSMKASSSRAQPTTVPFSESAFSSAIGSAITSHAPFSGAGLTCTLHSSWSSPKKLYSDDSAPLATTAGLVSDIFR